MARKTFISYKYSDVVERNYNNLRDRIIRKLGEDAKYYYGETSSSPNLTDNKTETIKRKLLDMIYGTSVMIIIFSPNMKQSNWMEWEIKYALRSQTRGDRVSHHNGLVGVVQKIGENYFDDGYSWFKKYNGAWDLSRTFDVIAMNYDNLKRWAGISLSRNYIDIVTEDNFMTDPQKYIEAAYYKSQYYDEYNH